MSLFVNVEQEQKIAKHFQRPVSTCVRDGTYSANHQTEDANMLEEK